MNTIVYNICILVYVHVRMFVCIIIINDRQCGKTKKYVGLANLQSFVFAVLRCYFYLQDVPTSSNLEDGFFTESEIYWAPASNSQDLYAQLSSSKFREILRPQIR